MSKYSPSDTAFAQHRTDPGCFFPMACCVDHIHRAIPPFSYTVGPFTVCSKQNLLLTGFFHNTHRSGAQASTGCCSKNSLCHLHVLTNIWASQTLSTRFNRADLTFPRFLQYNVLPNGPNAVSQHPPEEYLHINKTKTKKNQQPKKKSITFSEIKHCFHI